MHYVLGFACAITLMVSGNWGAAAWIFAVLWFVWALEEMDRG